MRVQRSSQRILIREPGLGQQDLTAALAYAPQLGYGVFLERQA